MQENFAQTYRGYSDDEIAVLSSQIDELADSARTALLAEIRARNLSDEKLSELRKKQDRYAAKIDRRGEKHRRAIIRRFVKRMAFGLTVGIAGVLAAYSISLIKHGR